MPKTKDGSIRKIALAAIVGVVGLAGCGGDDAGGSAAATVEMTDELTFAPARISVAPGQTITWRNGGEVPHDVVARGIRSPLVRGGEEWSAPAPEATGELAYVCSLHPGMQGVIVVE
jgi:plastocyanin